MPDEVVHQEKWRLALGLLDTLGEWQLKAPVVVADAGYGVSTSFRLGLQQRGPAYVLALTGKEVAHPEAVGRRPAHPDTPGRMAGRAGRSDGLLDIEPACHHPGRRPGAVGENALALGWGTHALAPLSFRAATYSGIFTLLPMLTGRGREHHGEILREANALVTRASCVPCRTGPATPSPTWRTPTGPWRAVILAFDGHQGRGERLADMCVGF